MFHQRFSVGVMAVMAVASWGAGPGQAANPVGIHPSPALVANPGTNFNPGLSGYRDHYPNTYPTFHYPYSYSYHFPGPYSYYNPSLWSGWAFDPEHGGLGAGYSYEDFYDDFGIEAGRDNSSSPTQPGTTTAQGEVPAKVIVRVPANAEVWLEGSKTSLTGPVRHFVSPPLEPGSRYTYEIRARWKEDGRAVTQTQKVAVSPGRDVTVNFPVQTGSEGQAAVPQAP